MNRRFITALIASVILIMPWQNRLSAQEDSISRRFPARFRPFVLQKWGDIAPDSLFSKEGIHFFMGDLKEIDWDSIKNINVFRLGRDGDNRTRIFFNSNRLPIRQSAPGSFARRPFSETTPGNNFRRSPLRQRSDLIDLTDPGIITYKKKKLSGGREKIIVIRKEVQELKVEEGKESPQYLPYRDLKEGDELREMNAPRIYREHNLRRKDLPAPSEVPTPAEKK